MLFNSWSYLVFLLVAIPLSYWLKGTFRIAVLFGFSILFYAMWRLDMAFLMLFSASIDFFTAQRIYKTESKLAKRCWLMITLFINLGLLVFFKYAYFLDDNISTLFSWLDTPYHGLRDSSLKIILPLGISFYTFHTISYSIDVYRGVRKPINNYIIFATYVTFWPQLMAGPILRANEIIPQLEEKKRFYWTNIEQGVYRILIGLFKKVVLADNIAVLVDEGFLLNSSFLTAWDVWIITILFGFQIYFDFAGYSDMAIGTAKMMGFHFPENFNWPYIANSPREFWKRWHISLSSWIRDYLYLPLMGKKFKTESSGGIDISENPNELRQKDRSTSALFLTWIIMGFWHGAGWNFALWGFYHAFMIYVFRQFKVLQRGAEKYPLLGVAITFPLMMASWIPFRSQGFAQTLNLYAIIVNPFKYNLFDRQLHISFYVYTIAIIAGMFLLHGIMKTAIYNRYRQYIRAAAVPVMVFMIIVYMQQVVQFIYFQF